MNLDSRFVIPVIMLLLALSPGISPAATITVNALSDTGTAERACELRSAILAANTNSVVDSCVAGSASDVIEFSVEGVITLSSDLPDISREVHINGPGAGLLSIDGSGLYRQFTFVSQTGNSAVRGLTLAKGYSAGSGGCIASNGAATLTLEGLRAVKCQSGGNGGALYIIGASSIRHIVLSENVAANYGGGAFFSAENSTLSDSTLDSNRGLFGGGIYLNNIEVAVERCTFLGNKADHSGGAISVNSANGLADISHTTISGNTSDFDSNMVGNGGGIQATSASLTLSNTIVSGNFDLNPNGNSPDIRIALPETITSGGTNFIGRNEGGDIGFPDGYPNAFGDFVGTALAPLVAGLLSPGDYGGGLTTMPPADDSPVVDLGKCPGEVADQRGFSNPDTGLRVNDLAPVNTADGCDIGAVELPLLQEGVFEDGFEID